MFIRILIFAIAACFFLENIVVHIVTRNNTTYYLTETGENDASENEDEAKKEKKEDFSINAHFKYFFISDILDSRFHPVDEKTYFEYCPEINLPPPDLG